MSEVICVLALLSANRLISAIESMDNGKPIRGATRYVTQQSTPDNVRLPTPKQETYTVSHNQAIPTPSHDRRADGRYAYEYVDH